MEGLEQGKESGAREFRERKMCSKYVIIHLLIIVAFQLNNKCVFIFSTVRNMTVCGID